MAYPDHICPTERQIIDTLIDTILDAGHFITVHDGEEYAIRFSNDKDAITAEVAATDETIFRIRRADKSQIGMIALIHGNGIDLIHDMTDTPETLALAKPAELLADTIVD